MINVYKEAGYTSHDVVARLRGICKQKRIGHTGTLDPDAVGVLPVCLGNGTRLCDMLQERDKEYIADFRLGITTDTQDISGTVLAEKNADMNAEEVERAAAFFVGEYLQLPPMYSALKVNGKKLYELARRGKEVERKPRPVTIYGLELLEAESETDFRLRCLCSKGTYIRTLCHDVGQALGCGGTLYSLRRTMAAGFTLAEAVTLEEVQEKGESLLRPLDSLFAGDPAVTLQSPGQEKRVRCGNPITLPGTADGICRVYGQTGDFLCLSRAEGGTLTSIKNFFGASL